MGAPNLLRRRLLAMLALPAWAHGQTADGPAELHPFDPVGQTLAPWRPGWLDIHHLATGRGNATLVIFPDATSLLIDAGASNNDADVSVTTRPHPGRRAGEWIGRYVQRHLQRAGSGMLDYLLLTHLHPDHSGDIAPQAPLSAQGAYRLGGVTDVAEIVKIGTLIDRGYPGYDYPLRIDAPFADNYRAYVQARLKAGGAVQAFRVGSATQIAPRGHRTGGAPFSVRNIAANGRVWSGSGDSSRALFPPLAGLARADWPNENQCSAAIRIGYGQFSYFTGGDITSHTHDGALPWQDALGPAARAAGPVTVATADHHGMFDGLNGDVVRTLRPRAWIVQAWHLAHPDMLQLERMLSERLYPGPREVFATNLMHANFLANGRLARRLRSREGHVVVRVLPGGERFYVAVTGNQDESDRVTLSTAPVALGG